VKKFFLLLIFASPLVAQAPPAKYQPTEIQELKLQNLQKDAQLAQYAAITAQNALAARVTSLSEYANQVKKENKWDSKVGFDIGKVQFCDNLSPQGQCPDTAAQAPAPEKK
jgi:hypothetical protein